MCLIIVDFTIALAHAAHSFDDERKREREREATTLERATIQFALVCEERGVVGGGGGSVVVAANAMVSYTSALECLCAR